MHNTSPKCAHKGSDPGSDPLCAHFVVVGAGIIGLAVARELQRAYPGKSILIIEKASHVAAEQTGNNSGVIHSGVYYKPGSLKARLATQGCQQLYDFCQQHNIQTKRCGKLIVAVNDLEKRRLKNLEKRAKENGVDASWLEQSALKEQEPNIEGIAALRIPITGIVNFKQVTEKLAELFKEQGGEIQFDTQLLAANESNDEINLETSKKSIKAKYMINCAGLQSDRVAKLMGFDTPISLIPFRGDYFLLNPEKSKLMNHLIYPVPDPNLPFLGVHFTEKLNGDVVIGPNAILNFSRNYKAKFNLKDCKDIATHFGLWRFILKNFKSCSDELFTSLSKNYYLKYVRKYFPQVNAEDFDKQGFGIRAQAMDKQGKLIDDFVIERSKNSLHVLNAPSPAATASLAIAREIIKMLNI